MEKMKIKLGKYTIRDLVKNFEDNQDLGVSGLGGKLNIRPAYQREFIYNDEEQNKVINSVLHEFPLNVMYWFKTNDGKYEILDGQQRTLSICYFCRGDFAYVPKNNEIIDKPQYFHSLPNDLKEKFLDYELTIYICDGTDSQKLDWFETINIAGKTLTKQELRNAVYSSKWTTDAKKYFSKVNGAGIGLARDYTSAIVNRQELLEQVISWIANRDNVTIDEYMASKKNENVENALELYDYFRNVIDWIKRNFFKPRSEMKQVNWGILYNKYKNMKLDPNKLEEEIKKLMSDPYEEIQKKAGIYEYVLDHNIKHLNLRTFNDSQKRSAYEKQNGICKLCGKYCEYSEMQGDHIIPWSKGGKTTESNLQMLCEECNKSKSNK